MSIVNHTKIEVKSLLGGKSYTLLDTQNEIVGKIVAGIPITERVDNNLYSMALTVKGSDKTMFSEFDIVTFDIIDLQDTTSTKWIIGSDNLQQYQPNHLSFTHELTLIEQTKILEKIKIFSLNLTNTADNLLNQALKAINNAETLIYGESYEEQCRFSFTAELRELLQNKPSEDFFHSNTDLRTVLDNILMSSDCRCYVEDIILNETGDITNIIIGYKSLKNIQDITPNWTKGAHGDIVSEEKKNNCQDYAGKILTRGYNSISQSYVTFTDTFKSGKAALSDESAILSCPFPIGENGFASFVFKKIAISTTNTNVQRDIDISSRLIPQEQYDLLSDDDQKKYIPYKIGDITIGVGSYSNKEFISTLNRMSEILGELLPNGTNAIRGRWREYPFTCTYHAQIDTASEVTKPNTYDRDHIRMGLMDSQNENNLNIARHGKHQLSLIRRTGNPEWYIDVVATNFSNLLPLMAKIDDGYVIYEKEVAVYDKFVKCRYYLSKDFNTISSKAGVNRTKRLYNIPLESDECPLINKQYLIFSKGVPDYGDKTYSDNMLRNAVLTIIGGAEGVKYTINGSEKTSGTKIKYLLLKTGIGRENFPQDTENSSGNKPYFDDKYAFVRPTLNYGQAKNMYFVATVLDNYSVDYARDGYQFSFWGDAGHKITYCRYVSKEPDYIGECNRFVINYAYGSKTLDNNDEFSTSVMADYTKNLPIADGTDFIKCTDSPFEIRYSKDRTQRPVFFTAIESIPAKDDFDNLVIGTTFARDNNLIKDSDLLVGDLFPFERVRLYYSKTKSINDTVDNVVFDANNYTAAPGYAEKYFTVTSSPNVGYVALTATEDALNLSADIKSWVIANQAGEVYIGANGIPETIYACFRRYPLSSSEYVAVFSDYVGGTDFGTTETGFLEYTFDSKTGLFTVSNLYSLSDAKVGDVFYRGRWEGSDTGNPYTSLTQYRVTEINEYGDVRCAYGYLTAERS